MSRDLRADALAIFRAAVEAVEPGRLVREHLRRERPAVGRTLVVAVGKASAAMARAALDELGQTATGAIVIGPPGGETVTGESIERFEGGHPVPNAAGVAGSRKILAAVAELADDDLVLCLISGGGSALMTLPAGDLTLGDLQETTDALLKRGATIGELNAVRKHLDRLKGGRLARAAAPARVLSLILSDVVGDSLDVIASGPTAPDPTTFPDAKGVVDRYDLWNELPTSVKDHLTAGLAGTEAESPKAGDPCFERVENRIVGNNRLAVDAAAAAAATRGYRTEVLGTELIGEARELGQRIAAHCLALRQPTARDRLPACLLGAGETTVTVLGSGRGGRNQEVALGAAAGIAGLGGTLVASFGTDGIDGPTDAAGALVTDETLDRALRLGLDPGAALLDNDAYPFFEALGDLILTGPTGTNVMDLALALVDEVDTGSC